MGWFFCWAIPRVGGRRYDLHSLPSVGYCSRREDTRHSTATAACQPSIYNPDAKTPENKKSTTQALISINFWTRSSGGSEPIEAYIGLCTLSPSRRLRRRSSISCASHGCNVVSKQHLYIVTPPKEDIQWTTRTLLTSKIIGCGQIYWRQGSRH